MTIGFIGAGKCGMSLAYYFRAKGQEVLGFSSRGSDTGAFRRLEYEELAAGSDMIFLTVTDAAIPEVWDRLSGLELSGRIICHCSGALSSGVLKGADPDRICSVHPMLAFSSRHVPESVVEKAFFTLEGGAAAVGRVSELLSACGNPFRTISARDKVKYHAAACFASNFVVAVCAKAVGLLTECGFEGEEALRALTPLMRENMENILRCGAAGAITGPAARGDSDTIRRHIGALDERSAALYRALTEVITEEILPAAPHSG